MSSSADFEEDDGRVIADMSCLPQKRSLFKKREKVIRVDPDDLPVTDEPEQEIRPWERSDLSRRERFMLILGTLGAAFSIGMVYVIGLGLIILLMVIFW